MQSRPLAVLAAVLLTLGVAVAVRTVVGSLDAHAPPAVERILPAAKSYLAGQLDLAPSLIRYLGWEHRERDHLIVLRFEIRPFPFVIGDGAYLASRCVPIGSLDPVGMGGGHGVSDFETDPELEYLRSDQQPACE